MSGESIADIKAMLQGRVDELCRTLLPHGRRESGKWAASNPFVSGDERKPAALKVGLEREPGAWRDFRNGEHGDILGLIAFAQRTDTAGALKWARDWLGLRAMSREDRLAMQAEAARQTQRNAEKAERDRRADLERANALWLQADVTRSPWRDHALAYFAARQCPLESVPNIARETFRYARASEWWKGSEWETKAGRARKAADGPLFPAVHSAMRNRLGHLTACHVTFLDPDLPKKAPVTPAKLMRGPAMGAVIELAQGPENLPFWLASTPQPLIIAEGIETGLSLAMAVPEARVWAGGSLSGIAHAPGDLACVGEIIFARDNNKGNVQAQKAFDAALMHLESFSKPVQVMASHLGDDFNDLAQGEA